MEVCFTGTGTSQGIPLIGCDCPVCSSEDKKDKRLRTSVRVRMPELTLVIDTGPDFRYQMLRSETKSLDAVLLTHSHKDHIAGLDDIRAFNFLQKKAIDVYATEETQQALKREFAYVFDNSDYPGIPKINLHTINGTDPFYVNGLKIQPIRLLHYKMEVLGFRIGNFSYITDANYIAPEELQKIKNSEVLVLNALRHEQHVSHYSLSEAVALAQEARARQTYFTHISHQLGKHEGVNKELPEGMQLAYDGLCIELEDIKPG